MVNSPGVAVDAKGGAVIDPTKNVENLVKALEETTEKLRSADTLHQNEMREASDTYQNAMRDAESKRTDQLADLRDKYETRIADMLRTSVESTSSLVSTQLVQIQNTFNERVAKLEQFRWESGGKTGGQTQIISWIIAAAAVTFAVVMFLTKQGG